MQAAPTSGNKINLTNLSPRPSRPLAAGDTYEMSPTARPSQEVSYDYTEGASALDINNAVANSRRSRRDSQYSTLYGEDGEGAMFAGPGHSVNPSSVSRMSHMEGGRRSSGRWSRSRRRSMDSGRSGARRMSKDSQMSRQSVEGQPSEDETGEASAEDERRPRSPSQRTSVFGNLAHLFGRTGVPDSPSGRSRRPSISQRSSASSHRSRRSRSDAGSDYAVESGSDDERWGYASGEEDSSDSDQANEHIADNISVTGSMDYGSEPPSPRNTSLPLLSSDPFFGGESRIDIETPLSYLDPPPPGPPSRQTIYIADEDNTIRFVGYERIRWRQWVWRACCILSIGILGLLGHWFPRLWLRWVARERAFKDSKNGFVVVEVCSTYITSRYVV